MRIGRLFGIQIRIDYSWFLIFLLVVVTLGAGFFPAVFPQFTPATSWTLAVLAALLLFASVLLHELAHSLTARRFGIDVHDITLFLFGGIAQIRGEPSTARAEFLIAIMGPVTSLALAAFFWLFTQVGTAANFPLPALAVSSYLWIINLLLAIFNMLPGLPLDGGRVLRSAIWQATGNVTTATRWASTGGKAIGIGVMLWGAWLLFTQGLLLSGIWLIFIGWFLVGAAQQAYQQLQLRRALTGIPVSNVMLPQVPPVDARMPVSAFVEDHLLRERYPLYAAMEDGQLRGLVAADDVRRLPRDAWPATPLEAVAHPPEREKAIREDADAWDALTRMLEEDAPHLLVLRDGAPEGVVSREELLRLVRARSELGYGTPGSSTAE